MENIKNTASAGRRYPHNAFGEHQSPAINYINITRHPDGGITNVELKRTTKVLNYPHNASSVKVSLPNKADENLNDTSPSGYSSPGSNSSLFGHDTKLTYFGNNNILTTGSTNRLSHSKSVFNADNLQVSPQSSVSSLSEESNFQAFPIRSHQTLYDCEPSLINGNYLGSHRNPGIMKVSSSRNASSGMMTNITVIPRPSDQLQVANDLPTGVSLKVSRQMAPPSVDNNFLADQHKNFTPECNERSDVDVDALAQQVEEEMKIMETMISNHRPPPPYYGVHLTNINTSASSTPKFRKISDAEASSPFSHSSYSSSSIPERSALQSYNVDVESQTFYGLCTMCRHQIISLSDACHAMGNLYHSSCFVCNSCGRQLKNKPFYNVLGKVYCEEDYLYSGFQQTTEKCAVCGHFIIESILQALGNSYHPGCFRCFSCNDCLDGEPFTVDIHDRVLCISDYNSIYAPRCAACGLSIIPRQGNNKSVRIMSMDKDFHIECYRCKDCQVQLSEETGRLCYPINDVLLCKDCHIKRVVS